MDGLQQAAARCVFHKPTDSQSQDEFSQESRAGALTNLAIYQDRIEMPALEVIKVEGPPK